MTSGHSGIFCVFSVRTELVGQGAISRLAISQADVRHSGVYTCAVSDNISQSLRLHIIDGELLNKMRLPDFSFRDFEIV